MGPAQGGHARRARRPRAARGLQLRQSDRAKKSPASRGPSLLKSRGMPGRAPVSANRKPRAKPVRARTRRRGARRPRGSARTGRWPGEADPQRAALHAQVRRGEQDFQAGGVVRGSRRARWRRPAALVVESAGQGLAERAKILAARKCLPAAVPAPGRRMTRLTPISGPAIRRRRALPRASAARGRHDRRRTMRATHPVAGREQGGGPRVGDVEQHGGGASDAGRQPPGLGGRIGGAGPVGDGDRPGRHACARRRQARRGQCVGGDTPR